MKKLHTIFDSFSPRTWREIGLIFAVLLLPIYLFIELVEEVRANETLGFDEAILRSVNDQASPFLDALVVGLTQLGGVVGVMTITIGAVLLLWRRGYIQKAAVLVMSVGGGVLLNLILKSIFQRDRPELWERIVTENSYSFPSGHAMASCALALGLIAVLWSTPYRWYAVGVGAIYMVVIGFTRLYLGVHYPTDIAAGWLVSGLWVASVTLFIRYRTPIRRRLSHVGR